MGEENVVVGLANLLGHSLDYLLKLFNNVMSGYVLLLVVFAFLLFLMLLFRFSGKEISRRKS